MKDKIDGIINNCKNYKNKIQEGAEGTYGKVMETAEEVLRNPTVKVAVDSAQKKIMSGAKVTGQVLETSAKKIQQTTDIVTGTKHLELLNERLLEQQKFNEAVATRLLDVLKRLEKLEIRVNELKMGK